MHITHTNLALPALGHTTPLIGALLVLLAPGLASAQALDLLELRSEYLPPTDLAGDRPAGRTPWSSADDAQVSTYSAGLNVPLMLGDATVLVPGLGYRLDKVSFSHESPDERELDLHEIELPVTLIHAPSSDWMLLFRLKPALASDFRGVDSRAVTMEGRALASHQFSEELVLGAGAGAVLEFGSLLPLPLLHLQWEPVEQLSIQAVLPLNVDTTLALGDRFEVGLHADVDGSGYAIGSSSIRDAWPCVAEVDDPTTTDDEAQPDRSQCIDHVAYSVATAGGTFGVRVVETVWLSLYVGHTFFRRFEQMNEDNERVNGGTQTLPDVFFARVGLTWRLPEGNDDNPKETP